MSIIDFSRKLSTHIVGGIIAFGYQKWSKSWCRDEVDIDRLDQLLERGEDVILVFWHGKFIPLFALLEGHDATVFTSDCFRGEVITHICRRFGYQPSLIPPGGQGNAFRHVRGTLKSSNVGAFAVDGPLGPHHEAKPGAIRLASKLGHLIVPVSMDCDRKWIMAKRWDKRELPFWGATVSLAVGEPIRIPPGLRARELDEWNEKVMKAIEDTDQRAESRIEDQEADF